MFICSTLHSHIVSVKDVMKRWEGEGGACNPRWTTLPFTESSDTSSRFLLKRKMEKLRAYGNHLRPPRKQYENKATIR